MYEVCRRVNRGDAGDKAFKIIALQPLPRSYIHLQWFHFWITRESSEHLWHWQVKSSCDLCTYNVHTRGEREWLLDIWEREREWLSPFPNFGNGNGNDKLHSQLLGTGTGMKISFPIFGNGNGNGNSIPNFWEREWDVVIPGNDREREWHRKIEWKFFRNPIFNALTIPYNWYCGENHDKRR